jgi:hypothetical protein
LAKCSAEDPGCGGRRYAGDVPVGVSAISAPIFLCPMVLFRSSVLTPVISLFKLTAKLCTLCRFHEQHGHGPAKLEAPNFSKESAFTFVFYEIILYISTSSMPL